MKTKEPFRRKGISRSIGAIVIALISSSLTLSAQTEKSSSSFTYLNSLSTNYVFLYDWIPTNLSASSDIMTGECAQVSWNKPKTPSLDNAYPIRNYILQWSKNADFSGANSLSITAPDDYSHTSARITKLSLNTKYYLRVRAINDYTSNDWSQVFSFVTFDKDIFGYGCT